MKRRHFLRTAMLLMAAGNLAQVSSPAFAATDLRGLSDKLLKAHANRTSASAIGAAVVKQERLSPYFNNLVRGLIHDLDIRAEHQSELSIRDLRLKIQHRTSEDFRLGRTLHVQGWILGRTEAWLCALAALEPESSGPVA